MKTTNFKIKVSYSNGFSIREIIAKSFGYACFMIEKADNKNAMYPTSFTLVE